MKQREKEMHLNRLLNMQKVLAAKRSSSRHQSCEKIKGFQKQLRHYITLLKVDAIKRSRNNAVSSKTG